MGTTDRIAASEWRDLARSLKDDGWSLMDLCGLDCAGLSVAHRFEAVVQLLHTDSKQRRTVHVAAAGEPPEVPSVTGLWPTADFMEREAFDLFGIHFSGHPNLTRILMPDEWEGHPLRKDYGVGKVQVEFVPQPMMQVQAPGQSPNAEESLIDVDALGQTHGEAKS